MTEDSMEITLDCIPCMLKQALESSRLVTNDIDKQKKIIEEALTVYSITKQKDGSGKFEIIEEKLKLEDILKKYLGLDNVKLLRCAGGDLVDAPREQWNDGSNTLAIAPGEVIVYNRNFITNNILKEHGIIVHEIEGSELVRGRGGPRCMSMPLIRENL